MVGCQAGTASRSFPEVWYTFVADSSALRFSLTAYLDSVSLHLFSGTCAGLTLEGSWCGTPDSSGNTAISGTHNGLVTGRSYYLAVGLVQRGGFQMDIELRRPAANPAQDCPNAFVLAHLTSIQQGPFNLGSGTVVDEVTTTNSCFGDQFGANTDKRQPKWYRFTAGATGPLMFNINPVVSADDYDWAVWDITTDPLNCTTKATRWPATGQVRAAPLA